jgi:hypothetical protein
MTVNVNPLTNLEQTIETHWRKQRPTMVAELEATGKLAETIRFASEMTKEMVYHLVEATGCNLSEAWWQVMEDYAILPSEEDVPILGSPPQEWPLDRLQEMIQTDEEA